jgi:hypothetical protein
MRQDVVRWHKKRFNEVEEVEMSPSPKLEAVRKLYEKDEVAQAFLDHCAERKNNQRESKIHNVMKIVREAGHEVSRSKIVALFKNLQSCGCGEMVLGRWQYPTRFVWNCAMTSVGRAVAGEEQQIEEFPPESEESEETVELLVHTFHLRPKLQVELELPKDLTGEEAERLALYMKTLPFDSEE